MRPQQLSVIAIVLLAHLPAVRSAAADVEITFPLGAYYRAGRYLPVHVNAPDLPARAIQISAPGAVTTLVEARQLNAVVPLLSVTELGELAWFDGLRTTVAGTLRPLSEDQRLVASTSEGAGVSTLLAVLFPGKQAVRVQLDPADPLPGPVLAWEALDAVLLEPPAAARVSELQLTGLLASGTIVAVRDTDGTAPTAGVAPWRRHAGWWVTRAEIAGPTAAMFPQAYEPVQGWSPGRPASFRRQLVLILAGFCLAAAAVSMWRARYAVGGVVLVSLAAIAVVALWHSRTSSARVVRTGGFVEVIMEGSRQQDHWMYETCLDSHDRRTPIESALQFPVFASDRQLGMSDMRLVCDGDGNPIGFRHTLRDNHVAAFMAREILPRDAVMPHIASGAVSPLKRLAEQWYARGGDRVIVAEPTADGWPTVVVERATRAPSPATAPADPTR